MLFAHPTDPSSPASAATFRIPSRIAFVLLASITISMLAGSIAPSPLYAIYQKAWGFSPVITTVIFGVYAIAVLIALLVVGPLSDQVGRRPVLLVTLAIQMGTMVIFAWASGVGELIVARIIQGLSTGAALGAIGAGLLDIDKVRGAQANAVTPMLGTGSGAIVAGLFIQFLPAPTHLIYWVLIVVFLIQMIGVVMIAETAPGGTWALSTLRPQIAVPAAARRPLLLTVPVLVAAWSLVGFYGSLGPALIRTLAGSTSALLGASAIVSIASGGALTVLLLIGSRPARITMRWGILGMIAGVGAVQIAIFSQSAMLFIAGSLVAGAGFGAGFQGVIRSLVPLAGAHERAGLLSVIYMISYLAMGLPAIGAGVLAGHLGLLASAHIYGAIIILLCVLSALADLWQSRRARPGTVLAEHRANPADGVQPCRPASIRHPSLVLDASR